MKSTLHQFVFLLVGIAVSLMVATQGSAYPPSGGPTGSAPSITMPAMPGGTDERKGCAQIDVWMPKPQNDVIESPTINNPNATVILDMRPPVSAAFPDKKCAIWYYHEGEAPPFKPTQNP